MRRLRPPDRITNSRRPSPRNSSSQSRNRPRHPHQCHLYQVRFADYGRTVPVTLTMVADEVELPMREPFARNASANESSLSLFKQSLKVPLGYFLHSQPTWRYL